MEQDGHSSKSDLSTQYTDFSSWKAKGKGLSSTAEVTDDGRISVSLDLAQAVPELKGAHAREVREFGVDEGTWNKCPNLNIVIMIVGSRGDVQPYVALGRRLLEDGHRVRIATHQTFQSFVTDSGLEFLSIGGNPHDLMSYMVKNPGLIPGIESLTNGDIGKKRKMLMEMMSGCWDSCHSPCPLTGIPFAADAIISNPPAFAHIHCAQALGIPLLLSFTMPWCPTTDFPHPLVNVKSSNAEKKLTNYLTYPLVELLTWQGMGDVINKFRTKSLSLRELSSRSGPGFVDRAKIPWTYCMSPALIPKPDDWKNHIDVVGFYFLDLATSYTPPEDLAAFLAAGPAPVYIGFGSVVVDDPAEMSKIIFEATAQAGVRALVSAGWGGLGGVTVPDHIFILGNVPHDWLFDKDRVTAVVHHGGAGTTAAGLSKGRPTVVVPFFGDQGFWGAMIHRAGAGPEPIPHKELDAENLRDAIKFAISPPAKEAARRMADQIQNEKGVERGVESFYRHLPLLNMRCDLDPSRVAVWWSTEHCLRLSAFAAEVLENASQIRFKDLDLHRSKEYDSKIHASDPISGGAIAIFWTVTHYYSGIFEIFHSPVQGIINTTMAIPRGIVKIVADVQEGFENVPKLLGGKVRQREKVTDFQSGVKAGGKSLFYGYYDAITGLVTEPYEGAKKEGFVGAVKGSARSFVGAALKPAAGALGVVVHPFRGIAAGLQTQVLSPTEMKIRNIRKEEGLFAVKSSSNGERDLIIQRFKEALPTKQARLEKYKSMGEEEMKREEEAMKAAEDAQL